MADVEAVLGAAARDAGDLPGRLARVRGVDRREVYIKMERVEGNAGERTPEGGMGDSLVAQAAGDIGRRWGRGSLRRKQSKRH